MKNVLNLTNQNNHFFTSRKVIKSINVTLLYFYNTWSLLQSMATKIVQVTYLSAEVGQLSNDQKQKKRPD